MQPFVHLHSHTEFSLLDGISRLPDMVRRAKELNQPALAITDHGNMYAAIYFYKECMAQGIKPIIGCEVYVTENNRFDRPEGRSRERLKHLILLAETMEGYRNLVKIVSKASTEGMLYRPRADRDLLRQYSKGIIALSACIQGEIPQYILQDNMEGAKRSIEWYIETYGKDNFFLEIQNHGLPEEAKAQEELIKLSKEYGLGIVASNDFHYVLKEDADAQDIKVCISTGRRRAEVDRLKFPNDEFYLKSGDEMAQLFSHIPGAIENTLKIAERCNVEFNFDEHHLPHFDVPEVETSKTYLRKVCEREIPRLYGETSEELQKRLDYELDVIGTMGFEDYFLIVWDYVRYAREHDILVGPGRGSAAGSVVAYLLGITGLDPLKYDLLFERFLNPERITMPDIDMDIPDNKRQQVLHYVVERYGQEQVAQIATLGTFGARAAMRDTLRVLGADSETLRVWARAIPKELDISLPQAYQKSAALRQLVSQSETNQQLFQVAQTIEGLPRHISTHAAAVVIHDQALDQVIPVVERPNQPLMTQFTMYDVEKVGLLKMDFLGLRNLNLLDTIIKQVQKSRADFDIEAISMEDAQTLALFRAADTNGVFQFESDGIKQVLRKLQPERFEDIVAVNALFRPGPMKQIDHYVARRHGKESYQAIHPILEEILVPTYGIIVYQEQVMQVCQRMAGFSLGQADLLRRAMGKKQADVMAREREHFITGAREQGIEAEIASATYDYIYEFASYGFNRSHAVVYSTLAFQLAYLKVHYPLAFYQALLNMGSSNQTTMADYILEAKRHTGPLLGLNLNESQIGFSVSGQQLQIGLSAIRTLRHDFVSHIVEDRQLLGPYTGLLHFMQRLPKKWLKHEWLESLICVGAFDYTGMNRPTLLKNLDKLMQSVTFSGGNLSLFPELEPRIEWVEDWSPSQKRDKEVEILGFSLEGHPVATYQAFAKSHPNLLSVRDILAALPNLKVQTLVLVKGVRVINTKKQELMAFLELEDEVASISGVVFPQSYRHYVSMLKEGQVLLVEGTVELDRQGRHQLIIKRLSPVNEQEAKAPTSPNQHPFQRCFVQVKAFQDLKPFLPGLRKFADQYSGPVAMILVDAKRQTFQLDDAYRVSYGQKAQAELAKLLAPFKIIYK